MAQLQTTGVTGSLTVTGQIIAQSLNVQQVTSSIVYSSGSNRFGSLTSNVQEFTGSLRVTGSGNHWIVGGNVGIGTSSPGAKLEVYNGDIWLNAANSAINPEIRFIDDSGIGAAGAKIRYGNDDGNLYIEHVYNTTTSGIFFRNRTSATALNTLSLVNGNVGIGVISPAYPLDVNGKVYASTEVQGGTAFINDTGGISVFGSNTSTRSIRLGRNGTSNDIFITGSSGNVGIGTNTPGSLLDIATTGTSGTTAMLILRRASGWGLTSFEQIYDSTYFANGKTLTLKNDSNTAFAHFAGNNAGTQTNFLLPSGSIGIGTITPSAVLHSIGSGIVNIVQSSNTVSYTQYYNTSTGTNSTNDGLTVGNNGTAAYIYNREADALVFGTTNLDRGRFTAGGTFLVGDSVTPSETAWKGTAVFGSGSVNKVIAGHLISSTNGAVVGGHNSALNAWADLNIAGTNLIFRSAEVEYMRLTNAGNVGIGTTSPVAKLDVRGNSFFSGSVTITNSTGLTLYDSSGTYGPGRIFTSYGYILGEIYIQASASVAPTVFSPNSGVAIGGQTAAPPTRGLFVSGSVGIGTAIPGAKLDVNGNIRATSFTGSLSVGSNTQVIYNSAGVLVGSNNFIFDGTNVGIGATSPLARLHAGPNISDTSTYSFTNTGAVIASFGVDHTATRTNVLSLMRDGTSGVVYAGLAAFDLSRWSADSVNARTQLDIRLANTDTNTITDVISLRSNGCVGIGTTAPRDVLDVVGSAILRSTYNLSWGNTYGAGVPTITGTSGSSAFLAFYPAGSTSNEKVRFDANGNVGIGTTVPGHMLDITTNKTGNGAGSTIRINRPDNASYENAINWATNGSSTWFLGSDNDSTDNFYLYNWRRSAFELTILSGSGNVGINTTAPATRLQVNGTFASNALWTDGSAIAYWGNYSTAYGGLTWSSGYATVFSTSGNVLYFGAGGASPKITLNTNGNLGIGTTSPASKFEIKSSAANNLGGLLLRATSTDNFPAILYENSGNGGTLDLYNAASLTTRISSNGDSYFTGGNVGIGTATPTGSLQVHGTLSISNNAVIGQGNAYGTPSAANFTTLKLYDSSTGDTVLNNQGYNIQLQTAGSSKLTILNGGNVGIGTTNPSQKLEIAGNISLTQGGNRLIRIGSATNYYYDLAASGDDFVINEAGTTTRFVIKYPNGNVGIGTNNPTTKLQVDGVISGSAFQLGPLQYAARRYTKTVENITTGSYTTLFNVYGDQLSSAVKVVIRGTVNSVVVDSIIDITANHSEDIVVKSQSGIYTILTIKILAATTLTEDFTVQAKISNHEPGQPLQAYVDVYPYGNEIIEFSPGSIYSTTILEHECSPGFNHTSVGGTDYFNINNGNVGIGTTEPNATLNIVTPSDDTTGDSFKFKGSNAKEFVSISKLGFIRSRASDTNGANMHFFDNAGSKRVEVAVTSTDFNWYSDALSTTFMTFKHSNGYIGIGTTSPTATLQVVGNARIGQYANTSTNAVLDLTSGGSGNNSYIDFGYYGTFDAAIWFAGYFGDSNGQFKIRDASSGTATDAFVISQGSRNITINSLSGTGNRIVGTDSNGLLSSITVGSGLSLSGGTLTATGGSAGTVTGTGASTQIAYWTSTSNVTGSNGLIFSGGNVGIGTTSPSFTLDAQGGGSGLRVLSNTSYVDLALANTSTTSYIQAESNNLRFFVAGGSNSDIVMLLDGTNDRVGIGTLTPSYKLQVEGTTYINNGLSNGAGVSLYVQGSGDMQLTDGGSIFFGAYTYANGTYIRGYDDGDAMYFYSNGTNTAVMRSTGVGIGTTSPAAKLEVQGTDQNIIARQDGNSAGWRGRILSKNLTADRSSFLGTYAGVAGVFAHNYALDGWAPLYINTVDGTSASGGAVIMGGNVGIGTTNPAHQLTIEGDQQNLKLQSATSPANYYAEISANYNYSNAFTIKANGAGGVQTLMLWGDGAGLTLQGGAARPLLLQPSNGNVGIGTTSPSANLDIKGAQDTAGQISLQLRSGNSNSNFSSNQITFGYANTAEYRHAIKTRHNGGSVAGNAIDFYVWTGGDAVGTIGTTRVMSINGTSVGIGTSSPAYTLDVSGTVNGAGLRGKYIPRTSSTTSTTSVTPTIDTEDVFVVTAQAQSLTINNPTGTIVNGQRFILRIKDNGTPQSLTFGNLYRASTDLPLPSITLAGKTIYLGFIYNSDANRWDLIAKINNF
jgi:hypothetical protein